MTTTNPTAAERIAERVRRVRKDGALKVATRREATALIAAAAREGYLFGQTQQFGGFLVNDMEG